MHVAAAGIASWRRRTVSAPGLVHASTTSAVSLPHQYCVSIVFNVVSAPEEDVLRMLRSTSCFHSTLVYQSGWGLLSPRIAKQHLKERELAPAALLHTHNHANRQQQTAANSSKQQQQQQQQAAAASSKQQSLAHTCRAVCPARRSSQLVVADTKGEAPASNVL